MNASMMAMKILSYRDLTMKVIESLERTIRYHMAELEDLRKQCEPENSANMSAVKTNIEDLQELLDEARKMVQS